MVLMIYNEQICKEILMPHLFNTDYQIRLSAKDYRLSTDIILYLERGGKEKGSRDGPGKDLSCAGSAGEDPQFGACLCYAGRCVDHRHRRAGASGYRPVSGQGKDHRGL